MSEHGFWLVLRRRLGWSFGIASLWTWGLFALRLLRDGLQPLDVWFGYGLSFLMTAVYVYLGLLIYATFRAESGSPATDPVTDRPAEPRPRVERAWKICWPLGLAGLALALGSIGAWLVLRFPGPQAVSGTYGSVLLAAMIIAVATAGTLVARGARR